MRGGAAQSPSPDPKDGCSGPSRVQPDIRAVSQPLNESRGIDLWLLVAPIVDGSAATDLNLQCSYTTTQLSAEPR